jgi:hypothetical protein
MPLRKLQFKPGVNKENTRYTTEGGWYECDKVRFRQGTPEKIGGWQQISNERFEGVCRNLINWVTLIGYNLMGVGTNLKYYVELGGAYTDITPLRDVNILTNPFTVTTGSNVMTVNDPGSGVNVGDFVSFAGAVGLGGNVTTFILNQNFQVTSVNIFTGTYTVQLPLVANAFNSSPGGGTVTASYEIHIGEEYAVPLLGWGIGPWGTGAWGVGQPSEAPIRLWSGSNYGEDLIFGYRGGPIFYWSAAGGFGQRAYDMSTELLGSSIPTAQNIILVSDVSLFVLCFGVNPIGSADIDPMFIRWSDADNRLEWFPDVTNQAGGVRLSIGSEIIAAKQSRQEIVVWTDSAVYSLQYQGPPYVWVPILLADNTSIVGPNAVAFANNTLYWMGVDKFYKYDGRVSTLRCDLRQFIFNDINLVQGYQIFAATNEAFNEVWWFYCRAGELTPTVYVIYNYIEDIWYYGYMTRTAWSDSGLREYPVAAVDNRLVNHEYGVDDATTPTPVPINAYISSAETDIDDGHNFGFIYRVLPDVTFRGSTSQNPQATLTLIPMQNAGSGYNNPESVGGSSSAGVVRTATIPIEQFTGQVYTRVRGRQIILKFESNALGTTWQLGSPRIDIRPDGRR